MQLEWMIPYFLSLLCYLYVIVSVTVSILRSQTARNKKFLTLFSIQILMVALFQVVHNVLRMTHGKVVQETQVPADIMVMHVLELFSSVFEIGIILTTCYGWMVAICTLEGSNRKLILRKSRRVYQACQGAVIVINIGLATSIIIKDFIRYNKIYPISQLVNYSLMFLASIFLLRKGRKLLVLLKRCEQGAGVKANKLKFKFIFYSTVSISLAGSVFQVVRNIIALQEDSSSYPHGNPILQIAYQVATVLFLLFFSLTFRPQLETGEKSLMTESGGSLGDQLTTSQDQE